MTNETMQQMKDTAKQMTFGVELEMVGVPPGRLAPLVLNHLRNLAPTDLPTPMTFTLGTGLDRYRRTCDAIVQGDGRKWTFTHDGSLSRSGCEIVSPILTWDDMPMLQAIARAAKAAGARTDHSCGVHVHVGTALMNAKAMQALMAQVGRMEPMILASLKMHARRVNYAAPMDFYFREAFKLVKPAKGEDGNTYGLKVLRTVRDNRYVGLNMTSLKARPTVEFRWFNGTLHAGKIKAYVQLCTHLCAGAVATKRVVWRMRRQDLFTMTPPPPPRYKVSDMSKLLASYGIEKNDPATRTAWDVMTKPFAETSRA